MTGEEKDRLVKEILNDISCVSTIISKNVEAIVYRHYVTSEGRDIRKRVEEKSIVATRTWVKKLVYLVELLEAKVKDIALDEYEERERRKNYARWKK